MPLLCALAAIPITNIVTLFCARLAPFDEIHILLVWLRDCSCVAKWCRLPLCDGNKCFASTIVWLVILTFFVLLLPFAFLLWWGSRIFLLSRFAQLPGTREDFPLLLDCL